MESFQKQMHLVEMYVTTMAKLSTKSPNHPRSTVVRQPPGHFTAPAFMLNPSKACETHSCHQDKESHRPVIQAGLLKSAPPNSAKGGRVQRHPASQGKMTQALSDVLNKRANSCQSTPQPGNGSQHTNFQIKGKSGLLLTRAEDNSRQLTKLIQRGVLPSGSSLQLLMKVRQKVSYKIYFIPV